MAKRLAAGRGDPWLMACALVTSVAASVLLAIHWLGTIGVIRDYTVSSPSHARMQRWFGVGSPSLRLTRIDALALLVFGVAAVLWVLRLAKRVGSYRLGAPRIFLIIGVALAQTVLARFFPHVIARGGTVQIAEAALVVSLPFALHALRRTDETIAVRGKSFSIWISTCVVWLFVTGGIIGTLTWNQGDPPARLAGLGWSISRHLAATIGIAGTLSLLVALTARWAASPSVHGVAEPNQPAEIR